MAVNPFTVPDQMNHAKAPDPQVHDLVSPNVVRSPLATATVIVVAHPDDEVVSLGSRLPRLSEGTIVHVTDGTRNNAEDARAHGFADLAEYAAARRRELLCAVELAGVRRDRLRELNCPDQEASLRMADLARQLAGLFGEMRATRIITHPYEGGHPDHDAAAFAVHAACAILCRDSNLTPAIVEATSYHMGPQGIEVGCFVAVADAPSVTVSLTTPERTQKQQMLDCFISQRESLRYFGTETECYRVSPRYDFSKPPHSGTLFYEKFNWGMCGERFCALAVQAMGELGINGEI